MIDHHTIEFSTFRSDFSIRSDSFFFRKVVQIFAIITAMIRMTAIAMISYAFKFATMAAISRVLLVVCNLVTKPEFHQEYPFFGYHLNNRYLPCGICRD